MTAVLFSCVAENRPDFAMMAHNLVISIRSSAGALAESPVVVNFVEGVEERFAAPLREAGADVRVVERISETNRWANKLRMLELAEEYEFDVLIALDCDVAVVGDPTQWVDPTAIGAKGADFDRFTDAEWRALFSALDIPVPQRAVIATATGGLMYPYFNSGVLFVPRDQCGRLREAWSAVYGELSDLLVRRPGILREQWRWLADPPVWHVGDQAALALAVLKARLPWYALPDGLNFPSHVRVRPEARMIDPIIVHYHGDRDESGFLIASETKCVNAALDRFNRRRAEVTGLPYSGLKRRSLVERLRRGLLVRIWGFLDGRTWYRSPSVTRARRELKGVVRSLRRA